MFRLIPADQHIWNLDAFVDFLIENQGRAISVNTNAEPCCARSIGLYHWLEKFHYKDVTLFTSNPLESNEKYKIEMFLPYKFFNITEPIESDLHVWNKKFIFGGIYAREKWYRLGLFNHLFETHKKVSLVSLLANPNDVDKVQLFELNCLWQYHKPSFEKFAKNFKFLPLRNELLDDYAPTEQLPKHSLTTSLIKQTKKTYPYFLIEVVAETFVSGDTFGITEKTVRPMLLKKPFILMGAKNNLAYLRQMGFRTFSDFWDEDYDGFEGPDRYKKIINLIDNLAGKSISNLEKMYWDMQYTLDHNYKLLLEQKFSTSVCKIL